MQSRTNQRVRRAALVGLVGLSLTIPAAAFGTPTQTTATDAEAANPITRVLFRQALQLARAGKLEPNSTLEKTLSDYPLAPYLTAASLRRALRIDATPALDRQVQQFIQTHRDWPPARRLRQRWLVSLIQRQRWQQLLAATGQRADRTRVRCGVVHAQIVRGQKPVESALDLWHAGHSQPNACDPVFAWLKRSGHLTPDVIVERARLALNDNQQGLARYLSRKLDTGSRARQRVTNWLDVTQQPSQLASTRDLPGSIALAVFKRLALSNLDRAASILPDVVDQLDINTATRYQMRRWIALLYAENHEATALKWFKKIADKRMADDEHAIGWAVRSAVYQGRWHRALGWLDAMSGQIADKPEWRYWRARTLAKLDRRSKAQSIYRKLSQKRAYYGFLAADRVGQAYQLNAQPLADNARRRQIARRPAIVRARLLYRANLNHRATREWRSALADADKSTLAQAAALADNWGWHARAITTLARADYWNDLAIRYPTPHKKLIQDAASANGISSALILAVMRTESLFQSKIRSSANAVGLMQIRPRTARYVANSLSDNTLAAGPLTDPAINIRLGSRLLTHLRQRWGGNPALAVASYNAGKGKVRSWLPNRKRAADIWIANIPYTETRRYVERILKHTIVFEKRLGGGAKRLDKRLHPITPNYTAATASR
ncbi:transglycosylase SLT domain-containing protein [Salinisphaera sp. USBA-960]|uniref:transglycosylase SLT domain-containing protein n=1 Tax=Salinisphaera orenii TaxID=856731 RepID=UPI000DBE23DD|nr:transglycosylase SLT domain-containing protein [Salifodinibacter halophilus]NNC25965.1 transglycosylase SLT domain-containing protein [Salifodinibacter halophilus]